MASRATRRALRGGLRRCGASIGRERLEFAMRLTLAAAFTACVATGPAVAADPPNSEAPKRGGALTYLIATDAPPSFDAHREQSYALIHPVAPYYSVLI